MARWIETLAEFDLQIEHRAGRLHSNADALSRHSCKQCFDKQLPTVWIDECQRAEEILEPLSVRAFRLLPELTIDDIATMKAEDTEIGPAYTVFAENTDPSPDEIRAFPRESKMLLSSRPEIQMQDSVLVRRTDDRLQLVVPVQLRRRLFDLAHAGSSAAHLGAIRTIIQLKTHYYWVGLNTDIHQWCRQCAQCARAKGAPLRPHDHMRNIIAGAPLDLVTMDILSGLSVAADGSKHILVLCDHFTKWVEAYPLPDQEASTCMRAAYEGFFSRFGYPLQIHTVQGRNSESIFKEICALTGVTKTRTTPFHPRSDGLTERANRTILQTLRTTCHDHAAGWPSKLPVVLSAYRMTRHKATGITPNMAMFGREVLLPCSLIAAPPNDTNNITVPFVDQHRQRMREAHALVRANLNAYAHTQKRYFDTRVKPVRIREGQKVWLFWPCPLLRQKHRKLFSPWEGPCTLQSFLTPITAVIKHDITGRLWPCTLEPPQTPTTDSQPVPNGTTAAEPSLPLSVTRTGRAIRKPARYFS